MEASDSNSKKVYHVTRKEMVSGFINDSEERTRRLIEENWDHILFVDERYGLSEGFNRVPTDKGECPFPED